MLLAALFLLLISVPFYWASLSRNQILHVCVYVQQIAYCAICAYRHLAWKISAASCPKSCLTPQCLMKTSSASSSRCSPVGWMNSAPISLPSHSPPHQGKRKKRKELNDLQPSFVFVCCLVFVLGQDVKEKGLRKGRGRIFNLWLSHEQMTACSFIEGHIDIKHYCTGLLILYLAVCEWSCM